MLIPVGKADIHILLVEDDQDDRMIVRRMLSRSDHRLSLQEAENGREALDLLERLSASPDEPRPEIVILDLNMPVMDGREFLAACRAHEQEWIRKIPIVVMTTSRETEVLAEARKLGANATLSKGASLEVTGRIAAMIVDYWFTGSIDWELYETLQAPRQV